jgi:hypothetical protein
MKFEKIPPLGYRLRGFYRSRFAITVFYNLFIFLYFVGNNSFIHVNSKIHSVCSFGVCECNVRFGIVSNFLFVLISLKNSSFAISILVNYVFCVASFNAVYLRIYFILFCFVAILRCSLQNSKLLQIKIIK